MDENLKLDENYYMTLQETAKYMRVSDSFLHKKVKDPESDIPFLRVGRKYLFRRPQIDEWLQKGAKH